MKINILSLKFKQLLLVLILPVFCFSQKHQDSLLDIWKNKKLSDSSRANAYNKYISKNFEENKTDSAYIFVTELIKFTEDNKLASQKSNALITLGNIQYIVGDYSKAIKNYTKSLDFYQRENNKKGEASCYNNIGRIYRANWNFDGALNYYNKSLSISNEIGDTLTIATNLMNIGNVYNLRFKPDKALEYYNQCLELFDAMDNDSKISITLINIGSSYIIKKDYKRAELEINKAIVIANDKKNNNILANAYNTLAQSNFKQKKYDMLIKTARTGLFYSKKASNKSKIRGSHYFLFEGFRGKKNFDSTYYHYDKRREYNDDFGQVQAAISLQEMQINSNRQTDSLINIEKQLKTGIAHQKEKTNLTLAWGGSLSAVSIFAFLIFRNTKRKQRKAEKERQDQIEEKEKILIDLELNTIDAMIEGQEKERQRLAADLHDSVGATLSAAKLQFDYLINSKEDFRASEDLIKKTSTLLEDAYVEIRSMAHLKNSGVMAKNGLLPAINKLTENASGINGLSFEVQSFGLDQRLENSLEISIFRIIQELVTNIIKHANATQGIVHLTNHDDNLNIMVEDNGVGFNPKQINKTSSGMGISNIDKRVEHLDGKLTIESEENKGTTIIIDIPL